MNWYYVENGQQKGPVTQDQLDELARQGTIKADSLVWTDGKANWLPYSQARPGSGPGGLQCRELRERVRVQPSSLMRMVMHAVAS